MPNFYNGFEGGTNGTNLTQGSGGNSGPQGNFFDAVTISGTNVVAFDNTHVAHGSLSCKISTVAPNNNAWLQWGGSFGGNFSQIWWRGYYFFTANPAVTTALYQGDSSSTICGKFSVNTSGKIIATDAAGTTQLTSTNTIPTNAWFRVEGFIIGSATVGQLEFKLFTASAGDTATALETQTSGATLGTNTTMNNHRFGVVNTQGITYWLDDPAISSTGYVGFYNAITGTGAAETGSGLDQGPIAAHEEIGVDDAAGFP